MVRSGWMEWHVARDEECQPPLWNASRYEPASIWYDASQLLFELELLLIRENTAK